MFELVTLPEVISTFVNVFRLHFRKFSCWRHGINCSSFLGCGVDSRSRSQVDDFDGVTQGVRTLTSVRTACFFFPFYCFPYLSFSFCEDLPSHPLFHFCLVFEVHSLFFLGFQLQKGLSFIIPFFFLWIVSGFKCGEVRDEKLPTRLQDSLFKYHEFQHLTKVLTFCHSSHYLCACRCEINKKKNCHQVNF